MGNGNVVLGNHCFHVAPSYRKAPLKSVPNQRSPRPSWEIPSTLAVPTMGTSGKVVSSDPSKRAAPAFVPSHRLPDRSCVIEKTFPREKYPSVSLYRRQE